MMPSVEFGVKKITKGSARDIDNRQIADESKVVRSTKHTIEELLIPRKRRKNDNDNTPKQQKEAEQVPKASLADSQQKRERADKAHATRERNRAE